MTTPGIIAAERDLAISYAPTEGRAGLAALLALDERLGEVCGAGRAPLAAQLRFAWWRDTLATLDQGAIPAEPTLAALARHVLPRGVRGVDLVAIVDGWEHCLAEPFDRAAMSAFAVGRGATLFTQAARLLVGDGYAASIGMVGEGWALAAVASRTTDPAISALACDGASGRLAGVMRRPWPRPLRPLGALALMARMDLAGIAPGSPRRTGRLLWHRLTGR